MNKVWKIVLVRTWHTHCKSQFKDESVQLSKQQIIAPLCAHKTSEWCNNFVFIPKPSEETRVCLNPARLNQALIKPVHWGMTTDDIFPKLTCMSYITLIDASSGYHKLKLDGRSLYLMKFACQFRRYRYARLPFSTAPTGDIFQRKIDESLQRNTKCFWHCGWHISFKVSQRWHIPRWNPKKSIENMQKKN